MPHPTAARYVTTAFVFAFVSASDKCAGCVANGVSIQSEAHNAGAQSPPWAHPPSPPLYVYISGSFSVQGAPPVPVDGTPTVPADGTPPVPVDGTPPVEAPLPKRRRKAVAAESADLTRGGQMTPDPVGAPTVAAAAPTGAVAAAPSATHPVAPSPVAPSATRSVSPSASPSRSLGAAQEGWRLGRVGMGAAAQNEPPTVAEARAQEAERTLVTRFRALDAHIQAMLRCARRSKGYPKDKCESRPIQLERNHLGRDLLCHLRGHDLKPAERKWGVALHAWRPINVYIYIYIYIALLPSP